MGCLKGCCHGASDGHSGRVEQAAVSSLAESHGFSENMHESYRSYSARCGALQNAVLPNCIGLLF